MNTIIEVAAVQSIDWILHIDQDELAMVLLHSLIYHRWQGSIES
jgi:hypothetical protein